MSGSGARDGGSPPWGPADPVPDLGDTQAISGLGAVQEPGEAPGQDGQAANGPAAGGPDGPDGPDGPRGPGDGTGTRQAPGDAAGAGKSRRSGRRRRSFWRELPVLVLVAVVLSLVIKSFAVQAFFIPSGSMQNTLAIGDRVLVNKVVYHLRPVHRGDIIVFDGTGTWDLDSSPSSPNIFSKAVSELESVVGISRDPDIYIKRVIGLPGDHVVCCTAKGQITVDGVPLSESSYLYPGNAPSAQKFNITVPAGNLWVMGDHRAVSYDSRGHMGDPGGGSIPESAVLGRAFVIIWPPSQAGFLNIPATFEQPRLNASNPVGSSAAAGGSSAAAGGSSAAAGGSSAALEAALDNGTPVRQAASPLPLALGFVVAVPLTWLQRRLRLRRRRDRKAKSPKS